jgi:predicted transcriptional regulator
MTYEKAVQALVTAGLLDKSQVKTAVTTLEKSNVEFTYPDWAEALAKAGLIKQSDVDSAADVMQEAGQKEMEEDPDAFDAGLENAGIL